MFEHGNPKHNRKEKLSNKEGKTREQKKLKDKREKHERLHK